jgi:hypothetical protein
LDLPPAIAGGDETVPLRRCPQSDRSRIADVEPDWQAVAMPAVNVARALVNWSANAGSMVVRSV